MLSLALTGCGLLDSSHDSYRIELPLTEVRLKTLELASCPSPLVRLNIKAPLRQVAEPDGETVVITVPAQDSDAALALRFRFDNTGTAESPRTTVRVSIDLPEQASELDLGEGRLLNPLTLGKELSGALEQYFRQLAPSYDEQAAAAAVAAGRSIPSGNHAAQDRDRRADGRAKQCRTIGRHLDAGAVMISPTLAKGVQRQHRRDAINWLFKDDYNLSTDSPEGTYWEEGD